MSSFDILKNHKYINLETIRKNGDLVKTPVWFVQNGDTLYVRTGADSGKVKRIRNNGNIRIAPCKVDGALLGEWMPVLAREIHDEDLSRSLDRWLGKKYGLMKVFFQVMSIFQKRDETILAITERSNP